MMKDPRNRILLGPNDGAGPPPPVSDSGGGSSLVLGGGSVAPQLPAGTHYVKDANGNVYEAQRDGEGHDWYQRADGSWTNSLSEAAPQDSKNPKTKDLSGVRFTSRPDGTYATDINSDGSIGQTVKIDGLPGTTKPGVKYRSAPDGLHVLNDDGSLGELTIPKQQTKALDPALSQLRGMQVQFYDAKTKQITSMLPYQIGLAQAKTGQANASARLSDAKADITTSPIWSKAEGEIARLQEMRDSGSITQAQYDANVQGILETASRETVQGLTTKDQANVAENVLGDQVSQGNNRATNAADLYKNGTNALLTPMLKYGIGSTDMFKGALKDLLSGASGFQAEMGGAPVQIGGFLSRLSDQGGDTSTGGTTTNAGVPPPMNMPSIMPSPSISGTGPQDNTLRAMVAGNGPVDNTPPQNTAVTTGGGGSPSPSPSPSPSSSSTNNDSGTKSGRPTIVSHNDDASVTDSTGRVWPSQSAFVDYYGTDPDNPKNPILGPPAATPGPYNGTNTSQGVASTDFLGKAAGTPGTQLIMRVMNEAKQTGQSLDDVAAKYMSQIQGNGMNTSGGTASVGGVLNNLALQNMGA